MLFLAFISYEKTIHLNDIMNIYLTVHVLGINEYDHPCIRKYLRFIRLQTLVQSFTLPESGSGKVVGHRSGKISGHRSGKVLGWKYGKVEVPCRVWLVAMLNWT
jgi:hypothetical protein